MRIKAQTVYKGMKGVIAPERQEAVGSKSTVYYSKHEPHNQRNVSMSHLLCEFVALMKTAHTAALKLKKTLFIR